MVASRKVTAEETLDRAPRLQQGLLEYLLRVGARAEHPPQHPLQRRRVDSDQLLERGRVALARPRDEPQLIVALHSRGHGVGHHLDSSSRRRLHEANPSLDDAPAHP